MTSGPAVAARVVLQGWLEMPSREKASARVLVAAAMTRSSSTDWVNRRRKSRTASRQTRTTGPMASVVQPGQKVHVGATSVGHPGVLDERSVAHRDQPIGG